MSNLTELVEVKEKELAFLEEAVNTTPDPVVESRDAILDRIRSSLVIPDVPTISQVMKQGTIDTASTSASSKTLTVKVPAAVQTDEVCNEVSDEQVTPPPPPEETANQKRGGDDEVQMIKMVDAIDAEPIMESDAAIRFASNSVKLMEKTLNVDRILKIKRDLKLLGNSVSDGFTRVAFEYQKVTNGRPVASIKPIGRCGGTFVVGYRSLGDEYIPSSYLLIWSVESPTKPDLILSAPCCGISTVGVVGNDLVFAGTSGGSLIMWDLKNSTQSGDLMIAPTHRTRCTMGSVVYMQCSQSKVECIDIDHNLHTWAIGASLAYVSHECLKPTRGAATYFVLSASECYDGISYDVGCEDGHIYQITPSNNQGKAATQGEDAIIMDIKYPVTTIATQQVSNGDKLMITASLYDTMTLWKKEKEALTPVFNFEHDRTTSYTSHVQWSPVDPYIFLNATRSGCLSLWNLNQSWNRPVRSVDFGDEITSFCFSNDGKRAYVGHASGAVTAVGLPLISSGEDDSFFVDTLNLCSAAS